MARLATAQRERGARSIGEHDSVVIEAAVRDGQHVRVIGSLVATLERHKTVGRDDGGLVSPSLGKRQLVILECLVLSTGDGHVKCGVAAHRERQVHVAGVGDGEGLREGGVTSQGIGHVELKVERERLERLGRVSDLVGDGRAVLGDLDQLVLDDAREAVARHLAGAGRRRRRVVAQRSHDGEQDRRMLAPKGRVTLPQILIAVEGKARELGAHGIDGRGEAAAFDGSDGGHATSSNSKQRCRGLLSHSWRQGGAAGAVIEQSRKGQTRPAAWSRPYRALAS